MSSKFLNQNIVWAINDEVRQLIQDLTKQGLDPDLALGLIECVLPENEIYNIGDEDSE